MIRTADQLVHIDEAFQQFCESKITDYFDSVYLKCAETVLVFS